MEPSLLRTVFQRWFPRKDSNLRSRIQSPLPYRLATRDCLGNNGCRSAQAFHLGTWQASGLKGTRTPERPNAYSGASVA
jgi:hypothetical protein